MDHVTAENVVKREKVPFGQYKAKIICVCCNRFYGDLESRARPLLEPIIFGAPRDFTAAEQDTLAAWGAKFAQAVLGCERKSRGVPIAHRRALRTTGLVPPNVFVGFGRYRGNRVRVMAARTKIVRKRSGKDDQTFHAYDFVATFGEVILKVYGVGKPPDHSSFRAPVGVLNQVSPRIGEIARWPPGFVSNDFAVDDIFEFIALGRD